MENTFKFTIPGKVEYIKVVKAATGIVAATADFSMDAIEDIKIAVFEACRDITCHRHKHLAAVYNVECEVDDKKMKITVKATMKDHVLEKGGKFCMECPQEGDLGLSVIKSLVDEVEIEQDGKQHICIKMVKYK